MDSSSDLNGDARKTKIKSQKKKKSMEQKFKWHTCDVADCDYGSCKKSNIKRHKTEFHLGQKKRCVCGKLYTSSSLSRHKLTCAAVFNQSPVKSEDENVKPNIEKMANDYNGNFRSIFDIAGIEDCDISDVQEHTMVIKVITKKDGAILLSYNNFQLGGTDYVLMPIQNTNENQKMEAETISL